MTLQEFSIEFDLLYNNISSNQAPGLTEYEKSVFLTQAQEAIILDLYKGAGGDSFETTEEVTRYLSSLVKGCSLKEISTPNNRPALGGYSAVEYNLPEDLMYITFQSGDIEDYDENSRIVNVVPISQNDLYKTLNNPFKRPNDSRILSSSEGGKLIVYSDCSINDIYIKYLSFPHPIILYSIDDASTSSADEEGLTIRGKSDSQEVTWLPESLHNQILVRAVQIAKTVWAS